MTVDPRQNTTDQAIDVRGYRLQGQLYVPAASVQQFRALYGVDEQADAAGNHYVALPVAPHKPSVRVKNNAIYGTATNGAQTLALPTPGVGIRQFVEGFTFAARLGTALEFTVELGQVNGPPMRLWGAINPSICDRDKMILAWPMEASALATPIQLITTFVAASTAPVHVSIWGFNRAE